MKSENPISGSMCVMRMASGSFSATSSTSMPPIRDSIIIGFLALRSKTIGRVVLLVDLGGLLHVELVDGEAADVHAEDALSVLLGLLAASTRA